MKPIDNFSETFKIWVNLTSIIYGFISVVTSILASIVKSVLSFEAILQKYFFQIDPKSYICNVLGWYLTAYSRFSYTGARNLYTVNASFLFIRAYNSNTIQTIN